MNINRQRVQEFKHRAALYLLSIWKVLNRHKLQIAVVVVGLLVFYIRRPSTLLNPQLIAEDGSVWLQSVLNNHYSPVTLFDSYAGYLAVFPRLTALISGLFSLEITPLLFNITALLVQVLPLVYLWSDRVTGISTKFKIFLTFFYLCIPFTDEIHGNITNSQWYLALLLFILVFVKESPERIVKWAERVFVLIVSLSGPFSILLTPILIYDTWRLKKIPYKYRIVFVGAFMQAVSVLMSFGARPHENIGFSPTVLFQVIGGQTLATGLFGADSLQFFLSKPWITPVIGVLGIELLLYVFIKADRIVKYFLAFAAFILVAALLSPDGVPAGLTWWRVLALQEVGGRYFFIPHLGVILALGWVVFTRKTVNILLRITAGIILLLSVIIGIRNDFAHPPYKDMHYQTYIKEYRSLKPGQELDIPTNPGPPWKVELKKED